MAGDLLNHVQRHPAPYGIGGQGAAEAMGAHPLQAQAGAGLAQGLVGGACRLWGVWVLPAAGNRASSFAGAWPCSAAQAAR